MPVAAPQGATAPLAGSLVDFPVDQVLRLVGSRGRRGTFTVQGPVTLRLFVDEGVIVDLDGLGRDELVSMLFHLTLVGEGDFAFDPSAGDEPGSAQDEGWALDAVLADVTGRVERWRAIGEVLPSLDVVVRLVPVEDDAPPVELGAAGWNVVVALDGTRRIRDLTRLLGGDAFATMEAVHDLVCRGLAEVDEGEPPA